ncbi:uncharacterized protein LOC105696181 [Orussus abietinus]|uniref:uncharacterized protein LOC105696181 n=1 Tax=Orussus abietinus TaxID=222816 RepID=UPI000C715F3F|nr:uncharacterized protein LOC105696181 [Orussus abietinus]
MTILVSMGVVILLLVTLLICYVLRTWRRNTQTCARSMRIPMKYQRHLARRGSRHTLEEEDHLIERDSECESACRSKRLREKRKRNRKLEQGKSHEREDVRKLRRSDHEVRRVSRYLLWLKGIERKVTSVDRTEDSRMKQLYNLVPPIPPPDFDGR